MIIRNIDRAPNVQAPPGSTRVLDEVEADVIKMKPGKTMKIGEKIPTGDIEERFEVKGGNVKGSQAKAYAKFFGGPPTYLRCAIIGAAMAGYIGMEGFDWVCAYGRLFDSIEFRNFLKAINRNDKASALEAKAELIDRRMVYAYGPSSMLFAEQFKKDVDEMLRKTMEQRFPK